jgi:hypothetical protein
MSDQRGQFANDTDRVGVEVPNTPYEESRVLVGAPDYRVFIFGAEVTSDVFSVSVTNSYNERFGTARINVVNDNEKWILPTTSTIIARGFTADELSVGSVGLQDLSMFTEDRQGTNSKSDQEVPVGTASEGDGFVMTPRRFAHIKRTNMRERVKDLDYAQLQRALDIKFRDKSVFPFIPGSPLIQMADPIRIFLKNPWNLASEGSSQFGPPEQFDEEWYFAFTGFVSSVTEDFDVETNRSILRIFCEDIRKILRYMRVTSNPQVFNSLSLPRSIQGAGKDKAGIVHADLTRFHGSQAVQAGQTLVDLEQNTNGIIETMLFNSGGQVDGEVPQGVLGFRKPDNLSETVHALNTSEAEVGTSDVLDKLYPKLNEQEVSEYGEDWSLGALDQKNRFFVIVPKRSNFPNRRYPYDLSARVNFYYEWKSRFDVINDFVKVQDSLWYATPRGDIVLEFPQYDATPHKHKTPWSNILSIQDEFTGFNLTEDDRKIQTQTIATTSAVDALDVSSEFPIVGHGSKDNPELIARYGLRLHLESRPFKYAKKDSTSDSANALAAMWQELTNADAYRLEGLTTLPNFRAPIARPYFFKARNLIGFATQITHTVVWGEMARTEYGLQYLRHFDPVEGKWLKVGGNYAWNWAGDSNASGAIPEGDKAGGGGEAQRSNTLLADDPTTDAVYQAFLDIEEREAATGQSILAETDRQQMRDMFGTIFTSPQRDSKFRKQFLERASEILRTAEEASYGPVPEKVK